MQHLRNKNLTTIYGSDEERGSTVGTLCGERVPFARETPIRDMTCKKCLREYVSRLELELTTLKWELARDGSQARA